MPGVNDCVFAIEHKQYVDSGKFVIALSLQQISAQVQL
jgi:hypothetical protein